MPPIHGAARPPQRTSQQEGTMNTSTHPLGTLIETDVLVIGSGASGCGAALGAREQGLRVLLMDKGKLESSGCIGGGNDHYMAVLDEEGVAHDAAEDLIKFYAKPLNGWTPAMLRNGWYAHMKPMLEKLEAAGVEFGRTPDGRYHRTQGFGQPGTWWVHIANGMTIKRVMARIVRESGVDVLDRVMAVKILTDGGKACGALGWNVSTGEFYIIRAKTVVSAQGRSATRGTDNSTHNPYNVWMYPYNTSAGVVLGYDAGAAVTELDTYQRATMLPKGYGCPGMNGINSSGAHEINALGERFMGKYDPMWENGVRNNQIQGTFQEQLEGSGPPFYMDMRHVDEAVVRELQDILMPGDKATFLDYCEQRGVDFATAPMEVELSEIEFSGMLATDDGFRSTVPGLYNGCVFYTFSGSMCSGYLAGRSAASEVGAVPDLDGLEAEIEAERARIAAPLAPRGDALPQAMFEASIRQVMSYYMGFVRNGKGMEVALERLAFIASQADKLSASNMHELMLAHESLHLLQSSTLSTLCSLERRESGRSIYRRSDYPEKDPALDRVLAVRRGADGPEVFWL